MKDKFLSTLRCCSLRESNPLVSIHLLCFPVHPSYQSSPLFSFIKVHAPSFFPYNLLLNKTLENLKNKCSILKHKLRLKHKHDNPIQSSLYICFSQTANSHNYLNNFYSSSQNLQLTSQLTQVVHYAIYVSVTRL